MELREIPNFSNYLISRFGSIFNRKTGYQLNPSKDKDGYLQVGLRKNNKIHTKKVHRLVMLTFVGPSDLTVNHKDCNKLNNKLSNLEYMTNKQQRKHAKDKGQYLTGHKFSQKLLPEDIVKIRKLKKETDYSLKHIGKIFGVSHTQIRRILTGDNWQDVTEEMS